MSGHAQARPVLAVDIDEVLAAFLPTYIRFLNRTNSERTAKIAEAVAGNDLLHNALTAAPLLPPEPQTEWRLADFHSYHFSDVIGGSEEEVMSTVHTFLDTDDFADLPVIPGALDALTALREHFDLYVVTSRQTLIADVTRAWIHRKFGADMFRDILFGNAYGTGEKIGKDVLCQRIGAVGLIDDSLIYAVSAARVCKFVILFDLNGEYKWSQPDNVRTSRHQGGGIAVNVPHNLHRMQSWSDVLHFIEQWRTQQK